MVIFSSILAVLSTLADLQSAICQNFRENSPFVITGLVTRTEFLLPKYVSYTLKDDSGYLDIHNTNHLGLASIGDILVVRGHTGFEESGWRRAYADSMRKIGMGEPPPPQQITADQLNNPDIYGATVSIDGILSDYTLDDIDPRYVYLILRSKSGTFLASTDPSRTHMIDKSMIGATLTLVGKASLSPLGGKRKFWDPYLSWVQDIQIKFPAPPNPFNVKSIQDLAFMSPSEILRLGQRKATGTVLTVFKGSRILMQTDEGEILCADCEDTERILPGDRIETIGFPETDLFVIHLKKAFFRRIGRVERQNDRATTIVPTDILSGPYGKHMIQADYYGRLIHLTGEVLDVTEQSLRSRQYVLQSNGALIRIDGTMLTGSATAAFAPGNTIEATGFCIINTELWQPTRIMPRVDGFTIAPRSAEDIKLVSRPSWWTPLRLLAVIVSLFAIIISILIWNRILHRLIERRGRQLLRAEIAKAESDLRIDERTRLAAELHDTLSQNLSGLACQIAAIRSSLHYRPDVTEKTLDNAERMLLSSRTELKRCLWDLRSDILDRENLQDSIRETLLPIIGKAQLHIRFYIPRARISDTTAHSIISIIRELVSNSVNHGAAKNIRIAGDLTADVLRFSVSDDGAGFDPTTVQGIAEGHFGLQGIRERIKHLHGTFSITSNSETGTRAEARISIIREHSEDSQ